MDGTFELSTLPSAADALTLSVIPPAGSSAGYTQKLVMVPRVSVTPVQTVVCLERVKVSGSVLQPSASLPAGGVRVVAEPLEELPGLPKPASSFEAARPTDDMGRFELALDPGRYRFDFLPSEDLPRVSRIVTVRPLEASAPEASMELSAFTLSKGRRFTGQVSFNGERLARPAAPNVSIRFFRVVNVEGKPTSLLLAQTLADRERCLFGHAAHAPGRRVLSLMDFSSLALSPPLLQVLAELEFQTPTPIQAQSMPVLLQGKDLVGQAKTGSGKTAAFALPMLQKVRLGDKRLQGLVLCPTRELCAQVAGEVRRLGRRLPGLQVLVLAGGQPIRPQLEALEKGAHLAVGTPGRILDLLQREALDTQGLATVVLDEADRMLDMGFREDMETHPEGRRRRPGRRCSSRPRTRTPSRRSAGRSRRSRCASRWWRPRRRRTSSRSPAPCEPEGKTELLLRLLRHYQPGSAIVFCNLKATVVELDAGARAGRGGRGGLQGDLEQSDRDKVMARFRNRSIRRARGHGRGGPGHRRRGAGCGVQLRPAHSPSRTCIASAARDARGCEGWHCRW